MRLGNRVRFRFSTRRDCDMAIKDILTLVDLGGQRAAVQVALDLAGRTGAHVTGLSVAFEPVVPGFIAAPMPADYIEIARDQALKAAAGRTRRRHRHLSRPPRPQCHRRRGTAAADQRRRNDPELRLRQRHRSRGDGWLRPFAHARIPVRRRNTRDPDIDDGARVDGALTLPPAIWASPAPGRLTSNAVPSGVLSRDDPQP